MVRAAMTAARGYNIKTKGELRAYATCAVIHGPEFFAGLPDLARLIQDEHRDNDARVRLKKSLLTLADMVVGGAKA